MKTIVVADIGGTHSRFARFRIDSKGRLVLREDVRVRTQEAGSFDALLENVQDLGFKVFEKDTDALVLGVPGPVEHQMRASLANVSWAIDLAPLKKRHPRTPMFLINDFEAQAFACRTEAVKNVKTVKPGQIDDQSTLAVIGAGTGLGYCALKPDGRGGFVAIPSEAGHASFPFVGREEYDYQDFLLKKTGHPFVFGDQVLSGMGLTRLHEFLTGETLLPEAIATKIDADSKTARWFSRFYGRACRNYAFTVVSLGGLYIAGGVAAKNPYLAMSQAFVDEFLNTVDYQEILKRIPVYLNDNQDSGLWGAAFFGQLVLRG